MGNEAFLAEIEAAIEQAAYRGTLRAMRDYAMPHEDEERFRQIIREELRAAQDKTETTMDIAYIMSRPRAERKRLLAEFNARNHKIE